MSIAKTLAVSAALALSLATIQPQTAEAHSSNGRWIAGLALGAVATGLALSAQRRHHHGNYYGRSNNNWSNGCHWHNSRRHCGHHGRW